MLSISMPNDKPSALIVIEENIPLELREKPQWVLWRYVKRKDKWTKPPFQPNRSNADSTDPNTWYPYEIIIEAYHNSNGYFDGIGFVLNNDYTGIDIDHTTEAEQFINATQSYAELSPSGNGVHIFTRGIPTNAVKGVRSGSIEMYFLGRYLTVTGHVLSTPLAPTNGAVKELYNKLSKPPEKPTEERKPDTGTFTLPADKKLVLDAVRLQELIVRNNGFAKLWRGAWQGSYTSASEGAYGLLADLLAVTRFDKDAAMYHFKQSPFYQTNPLKYDRTLQEYDINSAYNRLTQKIAETTVKTNNPLTVLTEDEANKLEAPTWVLEGIIVKGQITVISGKKGSFKTFEAIHQTLKVAQQMNTLYIAAEDPIGVGLRRQAWRKHYNCTTGVMLTIPQAVKFHEPQDCANLLDIITLYSIGHVTIDTIAACTRGLNENAAEDMSKVLEGLETIRDQSGVNILVLAHESSKNANGIRGWSGIGDASYVELSAQRQEKSNVVTLKGVRVKMAQEVDYTHSLIEIDNTLVVTELVNPIFKYPKSELPRLHSKEHDLLTIIAHSGSEGITRKDILTALDDPNPKSVSVMLSILKKEHKLISQEKQGSPYIITPRGASYFENSTDEQD